MRKILVISDESPPYGGGAGHVAKQIIENLSCRMGLDVELLTTSKAIVDPDLNCKIHAIYRIKILWVLAYMLKLFRLRLSKYDAIIVNDANALIPFLLHKNHHLLDKVSLIIHGTSLVDNYSSNEKYRFIAGLFRRKIRAMGNVICVSKFMKEYTLESYPDLKNIRVWYPGVSFNSFKYAEIKEKNSVKKDSRIILTVSRVVKGKGFDRMFEIFKEVYQSDHSFQWLIIGGGAYLKEFTQKVKIEGYGKQVKLIGYIDRTKLFNYYHKADVFLLLSNFKESFGLVYLEAQFFGLPVMGSNKGGPKEIITKETGYLIDDKDQAVEILLNYRFEELKSEIIRDNALRFDADNSMHAFSNIINVD